MSASAESPSSARVGAGRLAGKTVIVAGAGGVQGSQVVAQMLAEGANVIAGDARPEALEAAGERWRSDGSGLRSEQLDVASEESWAALVALCRSEFGGLDGLVNCAAVLNRNGVETTTVETFELINRVNVVGGWLGIKHAVPLMRERGGGSVALIASIDGLVGRGSAVAYHASKGALIAMTRTAAVELGPDRIRVNTICPGAMAERMSVIADQGAGAPGGMLEKTPIGRYGEASDIAWAAVYLLSDESSFVSGTNLVVDGGYTAQ